MTTTDKKNTVTKHALLAILRDYLQDTDGIISGPESDLCNVCGTDYIDEQIRRANAGEECIYECTNPDCSRVRAFSILARAEGRD